MVRTHALVVRRTLLAMMAAALGASAVPAQEQAQSTIGPQQSLETVVVTGSLIKRADFDTPSPLQVITAQDLKESGYTSVSDVLRGLEIGRASCRERVLRLV